MYTFFVRAQSVVTFFILPTTRLAVSFFLYKYLVRNNRRKYKPSLCFSSSGTRPPKSDSDSLSIYLSIPIIQPSIYPPHFVFWQKIYEKKSHTHSHPVKLGCCCSAHFSSVFPVVPLSPPPPPYLNFQFRYHCFQTNLFFILLPFLSCFLHCGKTHLFFRVKRKEKAKKMYTYVHIYVCTTCYLIGTYIICILTNQNADQEVSFFCLKKIFCSFCNAKSQDTFHPLCWRVLLHRKGWSL